MDRTATTAATTPPVRQPLGSVSAGDRAAESTYRKALLTLDGSAFSREAIQHVSRVTATEVIVVQVIESLPDILARTAPLDAMSGGFISVDLAEQFVETARKGVQAHLDEAARQLEDAGVATVSTVVRGGKPGHEIVRLAAEEGCDVIVMSTHGRTGLSRTMLGSVADYVVHNAEGAAVLLIRPSEDRGE